MPSFPSGGGPNDVEIKIRVDAKDASKKVDEFDREVDELAKTTEKTSQGLSKFQIGLVAVGGAAVSAYAAYRTLTGAAERLNAVLLEGAKIDSLATGFENLSESVGNLASTKIEALRKATKGLVNDMDLMQAANKAVLLGVDDGSGKFEKLAGSAIKLGGAMGIDAKNAIESLTIGIGRQSRLVLDNLGVIVKSEEAYKRYAAANNTTVKALSEAERQAAWTAEAFRQVEEKAGAMGEMQINAGLATVELNAAMESLTAEALRSFAANTNLGDAIHDLAVAVREVEVDELADMLADATAAGVRFLNQFIIPALGELNDLAGKLDLVMRALSMMPGYVGPGGTGGGAGLGAFLGSTLEDIFGGLGSAAGRGVRSLNQRDGAEDAADGLDKVGKAANTTKKRIRELQEMELLAGDLAAIADDELRRVEEAAKRAGDGFAGFLSAIGAPTDFAKSLGGSLGEMFPETGTFLGGFMGGVFTTAAAATSRGLRSAMDAYKGRDAFQTGSEIGEDVGEGFAEGIGDNPISQFFNDLFLGLPAEIDKFIFGGLGKLLGGLGVFGSLDPDNALRRGVADWFANAFGDGIIFGFEEGVKKLDSLDFSQYDTGALSGLDGSIFAGFAGIGDALAELFRDQDKFFEGFGGQMAEVLAANLEDLNNLQIMLKKTGISAADLGKAVSEAYLDGNVSAQEFLRASQQIDEIYTQGIPGAVGATDEAFENLVTGGLASGRIAMDAFGDLAAEAIEGGAQSMEDLRQSLIDAGADVDQVNMLFEAFAQQGITSLEQLANIGVEGTANLVTELEKMGFAFEEPLENATELHEKLKEIDEMDPEVMINVDAHISAEADRAIRMLEEAEAKARKAEGGGGGDDSDDDDFSVDTAFLGGSLLRDRKTRREFRKAIRGQLRGLGVRRGSMKPADYFDELQDVVGGSDAYAEIMRELIDGTLGMTEAGAAVNQLFADGKAAIMGYQDALQDYNDELRANGTVSADTARRLAEATETLDNFGKVVEEIKDITDIENLPRPNLTGAQKRANIVSMYKSGEITAGQADAMLSGLTTAAGGGLDGHNDIAGALSMLILGTPEQKLVALKNLGIEAGEGGMSLGDIQSYMNSDSRFANYDEKFFRGLQREGINNIQDLLNITDEKAISVVDSLGEMEFPLDKAVLRAQELKGVLESFPDEINIPINIGGPGDVQVVIVPDDTTTIAGRHDTVGIGQERRP